MIYVNQKQLDQVEYLIEQSTKGNHVLFDIEIIRKAFFDFKKEDEEIEKSTEEEIEKHIENLILQPTLVAKKAYLENLGPKTFKRVVRTYFSIVENNMFESLKFSQ